MRETLRVGNASGYWGDDPGALAGQVRGGALDYVTLDFLAEITMVILQRQRARDPRLGYAYDFVAMLGPVLPEIVQRGIRVVANAGGVHVEACRDRIAEACRTQGLTPALGMVSGDDLLPRLDRLVAAGVPLANLDDGRPLAAIRDRIVAANAYLGAWPIAEALGAGAEIVVTGRTTDAALTLGPLVHELGWAWDDWDRLAAGTVAGHVLECGAQATGGNLTDWRKVAPLDVGYPIAEVAADGRFVVTKHPGTGGRVSRATVTEQLLYEVGDPARYLTPDVSADFRGLEVIDEGRDRVAVGGARGTPPPESLKVTMVYRDGWRAVGLALISGPDVRAKAERLGDALAPRRLGVRRPAGRPGRLPELLGRRGAGDRAERRRLPRRRARPRAQQGGALRAHHARAGAPGATRARRLRRPAGGAGGVRVLAGARAAGARRTTHRSRARGVACRPRAHTGAARRARRGASARAAARADRPAGARRSRCARAAPAHRLRALG